MRADSELFEVLLIFLGAALIGLMPIFAKFSYIDGANAVLLLLARSVIGVIVLVVFILLSGRVTGVTPRKMKRSWVAGFAHVCTARINREIPDLISGLFRRAIALGHGRRDLATVIEVLRAG